MDELCEQNYNQLSEEDLTSKLRSRLGDLSDLPQDHDLIRWIHATSVSHSCNQINKLLLLKSQGRPGHV